MGMFWLNPYKYIACDKNNNKLFGNHAIDCEIDSWLEYLQLLTNVNAKLGMNYPQISRDAWELENGGTLSQAGNVDEKQYWAGGCQWGEVSKLNEFINGNMWQIGWNKKDVGTNNAAKQTWADFEKVNIGDHFAMKSHGGRNDLKIHYLGVVEDKSEDGVLHLRKVEGALFKGKGPKGVNWFGTLVPIKVQSAIDAIFPTGYTGGGSVAPLMTQAH